LATSPSFSTKFEGGRAPAKVPKNWASEVVKNSQKNSGKAEKKNSVTEAHSRFQREIQSKKISIEARQQDLRKFFQSSSKNKVKNHIEAHEQGFYNTIDKGPKPLYRCRVGRRGVFLLNER